jgi:hypothetical protein
MHAYRKVTAHAVTCAYVSVAAAGAGEQCLMYYGRLKGVPSAELPALGTVPLPCRPALACCSLVARDVLTCTAKCDVSCVPVLTLLHANKCLSRWCEFSLQLHQFMPPCMIWVSWSLRAVPSALGPAVTGGSFL